MKEPFKQQYNFVREAYVKSYKSGSKWRTDCEPNWYHSARVAEVLDFWLNELCEGTEEERKDIVSGALGHDLLEDTAVCKEDIIKIFGETPLRYIEGMTKKGKDFDLRDAAAYAQSLLNSCEEVRLIKLSDLLDNYTSPRFRAGYGPLTQADVQLRFFNEKLIPTLDIQANAVAGPGAETAFIKYTGTGRRLRSEIRAARQFLIEEISRRSDERHQTTLSLVPQLDYLSALTS